ncbi:MAG: outer membrane beta-barrel family protein [candidate division WOR-3 bacterium]
MLFPWINGGFTIELTQKDKIGFDARTGKRETKGTFTTEASEWSSPGKDTINYRNENTFQRFGPYHLFSFDYEHKFEKPGNNFILRANYSHKNEGYYSKTERFDSLICTAGWERKQESNLGLTNVEINYNLPFAKDNQFEVGGGMRYDDGRHSDSLFILDTTINKYQVHLLYCHQTYYLKRNRWAYSTISGAWGKFKGKIGLRTEFWEQRLIAQYEGDTYPLKMIDFFPSLHLSYQLPKEQQMMASYSRRINRPLIQLLYPYLFWSDPRTRTQGNPNLYPASIHSFEIGYFLPIKESRVSTEIFYRLTDNASDFIASVDSGQIMITSPRNVGSSYALGAEIRFDLNLFKWWRLTLGGEMFNYQIRGKDLQRREFTYNGNITGSFQIGNSQIDLQGFFDGPSISAQGKRSGFSHATLTFNHQFFGRQFNIFGEVSNPFRQKWYSSSEGKEFKTEYHSESPGPTITLGLTYNFNNYRFQRRRSSEIEQELQREGAE